MSVVNGGWNHGTSRYRCRVPRSCDSCSAWLLRRLEPTFRILYIDGFYVDRVNLYRETSQLQGFFDPRHRELGGGIRLSP